jgi:hypothetical protein
MDAPLFKNLKLNPSKEFPKFKSNSLSIPNKGLHNSKIISPSGLPSLKEVENLNIYGNLVCQCRGKTCGKFLMLVKYFGKVRIQERSNQIPHFGFIRANCKGDLNLGEITHKLLFSLKPISQRQKKGYQKYHQAPELCPS